MKKATSEAAPESFEGPAQPKYNIYIMHFTWLSGVLQYLITLVVVGVIVLMVSAGETSAVTSTQRSEQQLVCGTEKCFYLRSDMCY